jgi:methylated-DNA-[protein]-cysteine S-methyltransferase
MTALFQKSVPSPLGMLRLLATDAALVGVYFPGHRRAPVLAAHDVTQHDLLDLAARELHEYFLGLRRTFSTPTAARGTAFQRLVWRALCGIAFGERRSYAELAQSIGHPSAARAVGAANAQNPLSIFVPCHRVVAANGNLKGYAGGLAAKRFLLRHEAHAVEPYRGSSIALDTRPP